MLLNQLLDPDVYTRLNLFEQTRITASHTLTLWENCSRYRGTGRTPWISVDMFRQLMGVDEYQLYADFRYLNARLIKPAIKQINDVTSIKVELQTKRRSRRISELQFLVLPNPDYDGPMIGTGQPQRRNIRLTEQRERLLLDLRAFGIQDGKARDLLAHYPERQIVANFAYVKEQARRGSISNKPGFAVWAIERDAVNVTAAEELERRQRNAHASKKAAENQISETTKQRNAEIDARIEAALSIMSADDRARLDRTFETWLDAQTKNPLRIFKSTAVRNQVKRVEFRRFMMECVLED